MTHIKPPKETKPEHPTQTQLPESHLAAQQESSGGRLQETGYSFWQWVCIVCTFGIATKFISRQISSDKKKPKPGDKR